MSMLSAQIDELQKAAEYYDGSEVASIVRYAADTIWQLRDDLQRTNAENAVLRTQLADVIESMSRLEERCAKLRELVQELYEGYMDPPCEDCPLKDKPACADCPICAREAAVIDRMRELGIEEES